MSKDLNIGMIGYGFMGKAHTNAYKTVSNFFESEHKPVLKALCARNKEKAQEFADNWGYESVETDWKALIARDDIDAVDICVPNNLHKEISIAAAEAGIEPQVEVPPDEKNSMDRFRSKTKARKSGSIREHGK